MLRAATIVLSLALPGLPAAQELTVHGSFRHMIHSGDTEGTVALDTLDAPSGWGVGATAGLRGEIVLMDGEVLISRGADPGGRVTPPEPDEEAVILAFGRVEAWQEIRLPHDMTAERLTTFLEHRMAEFGLAGEGGFPLRLQGRFPTLVWHVVTGAAPADAQGHGHATSGHANARSGMIVKDESGAEGEIVGIYTGAALEGIASHPGERLHLHFVSADAARSGHVDELEIAAGTRLLLPVAGRDAGASPYGGMETREIKSLSKEDIDELRRGAGWGLALPAELNGVPGPAHLLELREEIGLDADQVAALEDIFAAMQAEARAAGDRFIDAETALEAAFRAGDLEPDRLRALIDAAAEARADLRFVHLSRHLDTLPLLTEGQIARYNALRGYGADDPCAAVPEGHDPAMWRRHNGCD
ncbi:MAG: acetolactate decarboxylase [Paracoccaceae bacterium]